MPLLVTVMEGGRRLHAESLAAARERARRELATLPPECRRLDATPCVPVRFSTGLVRLREQSLPAGVHAPPEA